MKAEGIDSEPQLDSKYQLTLQPERGSRHVRNFLALAKTSRFRELGKLHFTSMDLLDVIGTRYAAKFLKFSMPKSMKSVYLESKNTEITPYMNSLAILLPRVQYRITISNFQITEKELIKVRNPVALSPVCYIRVLCLQSRPF